MTPKDDLNAIVQLIHVHICTSCGRVSRRDDPDGIPDSTGIFRCTTCGHDGPLNVHVLDAGDSRLKR
jgi:hypothetical protein